MVTARHIFAACRELRECGATLHPSFSGTLVVSEGGKWRWAEGYILDWLNSRFRDLGIEFRDRYMEACDGDHNLCLRAAHLRRLIIRNFGGLGAKLDDNYDNFMWGD